MIGKPTFVGKVVKPTLVVNATLVGKPTFVVLPTFVGKVQLYIYTKIQKYICTKVQKYIAENARFFSGFFTSFPEHILAKKRREKGEINYTLIE